MPMQAIPDPQDQPQDARVQSKADSRPIGPSFAEQELPVADLSSEIAGTIAKSRDERVTCRRIFGNYYRCNWWAPHSNSEYDNPQMAGLTVTTHRVRRSEWLRVTRSDTGLDIQTVSGREQSSSN